MKMKKIMLFVACSSLLLSSCDTYTGGGAYAGATFGSILGSAIGGLSGGPRDSDMGTIIGMAGGAAVGAAIGSQADQKSQQQRESVYRDRSYRDHHSYQDGVYQQSSPVYSNDEIFDSTNSGDDRIYDEELGQNYAYSSSLEIMNALFVDSNEDNTLNRNETAKVIFEIRNNGAHTLYDVLPTIIETTGNKHIFISPSIHVESIAPGHVIRYTAMVKADNRLKNGTACICVSVIQGGKTISKVNQFDIPTKSR